MKHENIQISPYQKYLEESKSPLCSLIFILPFLISYHIGILAVNCSLNEYWVNGADRILANLLLNLGGIGPFVSVFCIIITLLIWQHASNQSWNVRFQTILIMAIECIILAVPPFIFGKVLRNLLFSINHPEVSFITNLVLSIGAGIYEEFVFRMVLMSSLYFIFGTIFQIDGYKLQILVISLQAILFAFFHYLPGSQEKIILESKDFWSAFLFRIIGGVYFALIYKERGLGIATGTHAFYDIIAVVMNAFR